MEDCSKICIYVSNPLSEATPYLVHERPMASPQRPSAPEFYQQPYSAGVNYPAAPLGGAPVLPNGLHSDLDLKPVPFPIVGESVTMHPSDRALAYDPTAHLPGGVVYLDNIMPVPAGYLGSNTTYATTLMLGPIFEEFKKIYSFGDGGGHSFGYAGCMWLRQCNPTTEMVGSKCTQVLTGVTYTGYCFRSDVGSLECGRLANIDDEYGEKPINFDVTPAGFGGKLPGGMHVASSPGVAGKPTGAGAKLPMVEAYRCPTGSPAKTLGTFVSKRALIGGCMLSSDAKYDPLAEVHVPGYCNTEMDYKKGCLLPSATNFDPMAKQSGLCKFATLGCTDPGKLKFNPDATINDGSCVDKVPGCTVNDTPYSGVDSDTPAYRSGHYGAALKSADGVWSINPTGLLQEGPKGPVFFPEGGSAMGDTYFGRVVAKYDAGANVLSSCIAAVEGCMTPGMANYDPLATVNSNTWCVPKVYGCMMPSAYMATSFPECIDPVTCDATKTVRSYDGLALTYNYAATVNNVSTCSHYRVGCMNTAAINYDPAATVQGAAGTGTGCYYPGTGCLNPQAVNLGCAQKSDAPCPDTGATEHIAFFCKYPGEAPEGTPSPPSPPPPSIPEGGGFKRIVEYMVEMSFAGTGTVEENVAIVQSVLTGLAARLGITSADTGVIIKATICAASGADCRGPFLWSGSGRRRRLQTAGGSGGVTYTIQITYPDEAAAQAAKTLIEANTATPEALLAFIFPDPATRPAAFNPVTGATVSLVEVVTYVRDGLTDAEKAGIIAGCVIGGVCLIIMILLIVRYRMKRKGSYAKTVVPA